MSTADDLASGTIGGARGRGRTRPLAYLRNLAASFAPLDLILGGRKDDDRLRVQNEHDFWGLVERAELVDGSKVRLERFLISDWCPLWPGRYHQPDVIDILRRVESAPQAEPGILFPAQKSDMIEAGIGTIRLVPRSGRQILGATSTGWLHAGIPVVVNRDNDVIRKLSTGVVRCDIEGTVALIPEDQSHSLGYRRGVPRVWIDETRILDSAEVAGVHCMASAAILYGRANTDEHKNWSFYYFNPGGRHSVKQAVSLLETYMVKYPPTDAPDPVVLADFDETEQHFSSDTESSLTEFYQTRGSSLRTYIHDEPVFIDTAVILSRYVTMNQTQYVSAGHDINAPVTQSGGSSEITSNVSLSTSNPELDDLLRSLIAEVAKLPEEGKGAEIKRDAKSLEEELRSESPRKRFWELSLDGIKEAAATLGEIAAPVLTLATKVAALLAG